MDLRLRFGPCSVEELESEFVRAGEIIFEGDEGRGGDEDETEAEFDMIFIGAELLRRGPPGQAALLRLLEHPNPEVRLAAAGRCLKSGFECGRAEGVLEALRESRDGGGWPAFYAKKVLGYHRLREGS